MLRQLSSVLIGLAIGEVKEPPAVIPFEADLSPSHWYLWIRVERADVWPCRRAVLLWIRQCSVVWVGCVARPCIVWHVWRVVPWSPNRSIRSHRNWLALHWSGSTHGHRSDWACLCPVRCGHDRRLNGSSNGCCRRPVGRKPAGSTNGINSYWSQSNFLQGRGLR